jgi:hypothetical protein
MFRWTYQPAGTGVDFADARECDHLSGSEFGSAFEADDADGDGGEVKKAANEAVL